MAVAMPGGRGALRGTIVSFLTAQCPDSRSPARFIGPAVAFGCRINLIALYWSAELAGGILAALSHKFVLRSQMDAITSQVLVSATSQQAPANEDQTRKLAVHDSAAEVHSF